MRERSGERRVSKEGGRSRVCVFQVSEVRLVDTFIYESPSIYGSEVVYLSLLGLKRDPSLPKKCLDSRSNLYPVHLGLGRIIQLPPHQVSLPTSS